MTAINPTKDLIVLVADKNMEATFRGLLTRNESLGIRNISFDIFVHPNKDPGCRKESDSFLLSFSQQYAYCIVAFDREGCGSDDNREVLERSVEDKLSKVGWESRSITIVFEPELEVWLWSRSPHIEEALGWINQNMHLRNWLIERGQITHEGEKPNRPKETMEMILQKVKKPRSSSIYLQLAQRVSLRGHQEPAFVKFKNTMQTWFRIE
jgi:hypothetical protein